MACLQRCCLSSNSSYQRRSQERPGAEPYRVPDQPSYHCSTSLRPLWPRVCRLLDNVDYYHHFFCVCRQLHGHIRTVALLFLLARAAIYHEPMAVSQERTSLQDIAHLQTCLQTRLCFHGAETDAKLVSSTWYSILPRSAVGDAVTISALMSLFPRSGYGTTISHTVALLLLNPKHS
jgi:hypothetical protein